MRFNSIWISVSVSVITLLRTSGTRRDRSALKNCFLAAGVLDPVILPLFSSQLEFEHRSEPWGTILPYYCQQLLFCHLNKTLTAGVPLFPVLLSSFTAVA